MYCKYCGNEIKAEEEVCSICGNQNPDFKTNSKNKIVKKTIIPYVPWVVIFIIVIMLMMTSSFSSSVNLMIILSLMLLGFIIALIIGLVNPDMVIRWGSFEKRNRKKVLIYYGISTIVLYMIIRCCGEINISKFNLQSSTNSSSSSTYDNGGQKSTSIVTVKPKELSDAYDKNQINAEQKYKGKNVSITGKVYDIGSDNGKPVLGLVNTDNKYDITVADVRCYFSDTSQNDKISKLSKGQTVTIKGVVDGYGLSVMIDNCTLE